MNGGDDCEVGDLLNCTEILRTTDVVIYTNYVYTIIKIHKNNIQILDEDTHATYTMKRAQIEHHFIYAHCYTMYRVQASSINSNVILHQAGHAHASKS